MDSAVHSASTVLRNLRDERQLKRQLKRRLKIRLIPVAKTLPVRQFLGALSMFYPCLVAAAAGNTEEDWFSLEASFRGRYESLDGQFRSSAHGSGDQMLATRTNILAVAKHSIASIGLELMDSRQWLADEGSPINTSMVNTAEWVQGYLRFSDRNVMSPNDSLMAQMGRFTLDLGSRRFISRSRFRNTLNTFDGLDMEWRAEMAEVSRGFIYCR
jgi:hypothetical protein